MPPEANLEDLPAVNWDDAADVQDTVDEMPDVKALELPVEPVPVKSLAFDVEHEARTAELQGEPTAEQIAAAEALLARIGRGPLSAPRTPSRGPDDPVSDRPDPINLLEPAPSRLEVIDRGDVQIIADRDTIRVVNRAMNGDTNISRGGLPARDQPERITNKTLAEQNAGKKALGMHGDRSAMFPPIPKTPKELERERPPTEIIRAGHHPMQHLLNQPKPSGGSAGY